MNLKTLIAVLALTSCTLWAQTVEIKEGWVRTSVQGQRATGAFMKITVKEGATLVSMSSPVAGLTELHEMKIEGDVMKMRAVVGGLYLPAGRTVELKPGGYHLMLMDLKTALKKDSTVSLTLVLKDGNGLQSQIEVKLPVSLGPPPTAGRHSH